MLSVFPLMVPQHQTVWKTFSRYVLCILKQVPKGREMEVFLAYLFKMGHALHSQSAWSQVQFFKARGPVNHALLRQWAHCSQGQGDGARGTVPFSPQPRSESSFLLTLGGHGDKTCSCLHALISMQCLLMLRAILKSNPNLASPVCEKLWASSSALSALLEQLCYSSSGNEASRGSRCPLPMWRVSVPREQTLYKQNYYFCWYSYLMVLSL